MWNYSRSDTRGDKEVYRVSIAIARNDRVVQATGLFFGCSARIAGR